MTYLKKPAADAPKSLPPRGGHTATKAAEYAGVGQGAQVKKGFRLKPRIASNEKTPWGKGERGWEKNVDSMEKTPQPEGWTR
jgi:hypothetical protein